MPAVLAQIRGQVHGVTGTLWAAQDRDELMDTVAEIEALKSSLDALPGDSDPRSRGVQLLLDEAKLLDATELRKVARRLVAVVDPDSDRGMWSRLP